MKGESKQTRQDANKKSRLQAEVAGHSLGHKSWHCSSIIVSLSATAVRSLETWNLLYMHSSPLTFNRTPRNTDDDHLTSFLRACDCDCCLHIGLLPTLN